jgi:UDP-glucose 4-epimerase
MRCIVTGGAGFIGCHVVTALRQAEHVVGVIDIHEDSDYRVDIRNIDEVKRAIMDFRASVVFHIAGVADARYALNNPVKAVDTNIGGTVSILEAARRAGVKRTILASTCWVANAMGSGVLDESSAFRPSGGEHIYTTTKIASEMLMHDYHSLFGASFTILRYGIPYGPGMWSGLVLRNWMDQASAGNPLIIYGDGSASRRFLYIEDLAEGHVLALQDVATNQTYNFEGMRAVTVRQLAEAFQRVWGPVEVEYRSEPARAGEFQYIRKIISNAKAFVELGWEARTDLEEGLRRTVDWYRATIQSNAEVRTDGNVKATAMA